MARMPGRVVASWCPHCRNFPGPDCPDVGKPPKTVRLALKRDLAREVVDVSTRRARTVASST